MTILLLILLVVYVAVVSAPISIRLVGLILARNGLRELPLPGIDDGPFRAPKAASVRPSDRRSRLFGTKMCMSKEEIMNKRWYFQSRKKPVTIGSAGACRQCSFPHARFEWFRR